MRFSFIRILLPLTLLVAGPLLGGIGCAQAGYLASAVAPADLLPGSLSDDFPDAGMTDAPAPADETTAQTNASNANVLPVAFFGQSPTDGLNVGNSGCQGQPSYDHGSPGDSGQNLFETSTNSIDSPILVGVLFLEETLRQPPAFLSRLFRPPRFFHVVVS